MAIRNKIKAISMQRAINYARCVFNYLLSKIGLYRFTHYPTFISVEPSNYCILRCPECPVGVASNKTKQLLTVEQLEHIVKETGQYAHTIQFYFQGEPTLNRNLPQLIQIAKKHKLYTIVSTNALTITPDFASKLIRSGIDHIIVSIDGISQESYSQYRIGGNISQALAGLRNLHNAKTKHSADTTIEWQCLILKSTEQEIKTIKQLYKQLGADKVSFKTAQFYDYEKGNILMPTNQKHSRYKKLPNGNYTIKKTLHNHCFRLWSGCVISVEGNILPCCFDKNQHFVFGNIFKQPLHDIWFSDKARQFRHTILNNRESINICTNCCQ